MHKKIGLSLIALCMASAVFAQTDNKQEQNVVTVDESAFTFSESQLGEDDNVAQEVTILGQNNNAYASEVGYKWSPARFKYRGFNSKYVDIYINGNPANDIERGEFRYSLVGGLNNQTRGVEASLPFEDNSFNMAAMGGSNNYNFRPSAMPAGHRLSVAGANRNYIFRGMYNYASGFNSKGWAWAMGLTYRYAGEGYVEGTFYNALSYFLGIEKMFNRNHSVSLVTWGNPTEENVARAARSLEGHDIDTFVIDAGWYGSPQWWSSIGDWDVSEVKFPHGIAGTAKTIRDAGMRPGLWFELECATAESELAKNHPDWLLKQNGVPINTGRMFLDMENPAVRAYLKTSVIDFLRDNGFGYLKIDYNDTIGLGCDSPDGLGEGLRRNMLASQDFFREIFEGVPGIQIEICSSGGHRLEPSMLNLGTFSSFSDAHECVTIPVIAANLHRLMQPSKSEIWAVLRASDSLRRLDYSLVNTMLGVMCLSGDFAALNEEQLRAVDRAVAFYREASPVIRDGESTFFCPERQSYQHPEGWQAVVRRDGKSGKTLAVLHTFGGELPPEVTLPVPGGTSRIEDTLCSENNEIRLTDEGLVIPLHANFEAVAVLLS